MRNDFKNQLENIGSMGGDKNIQRYVKILPSFHFIDRFEIAETDFQTILFALFQIFIVETFAIADPVTLFVEDEQWYKNDINHRGIGDNPHHRLKNIPGI